MKLKKLLALLAAVNLGLVSIASALDLQVTFSSSPDGESFLYEGIPLPDGDAVVVGGIADSAAFDNFDPATAGLNPNWATDLIEAMTVFSNEGTDSVFGNPGKLTGTTVAEASDLENEQAYFLVFDSADPLSATAVGLFTNDAASQVFPILTGDPINDQVTWSINDLNQAYANPFGGIGFIGNMNLVSVVPEPATYALIFGCLALAGAVYRRAKK